MNNRFSFIEVSGFRNLPLVKFLPGKRFNFFYGKNGTGKTSLLEAIFHMSMGRSFRTHLYKQVIQHDQDKFFVFGKIGEKKLGIERCRSGDLTIKYNGEEVRSIAVLAEQLPIQLIDPNTHHLITGGPKNRRQFLDWGVFHVEHSEFLSHWKRLNRALKQRNAALKIGTSDAKIWDKELIQCSQVIDLMREKYISLFNELLKKIQGDLRFSQPEISYYSGWDQTNTLEEQLERSYERDRQYGMTHYGPHRADLRISVDGKPAAEYLSRGEQKSLVAVMKITQAMLLKELTGKHSIFLVDDLPSELDYENRLFLINRLREMDSQVFVTGIEKESLENLVKPEEREMFHVEQLIRN